jgi:hypothetical protein
MPGIRGTVAVLAVAGLLASRPATAQNPRRVSVSPAAAALEVGRSLQLRAVVLGAGRDTLRTNVRWTSSDTA